MAKKRIETGIHNGKRYRLHYDLLTAQFPHIYSKQWVWFLWLNRSGSDGYLGNFTTKAAAMYELDHVE
jgi:hypothetical protein